jgi:hypothetical protein
MRLKLSKKIDTINWDVLNFKYILSKWVKVQGYKW